MWTESIGHELITTTNSPHLAGIDSELRARLSELFSSRASIALVSVGDEQTSGGPGKAWSRLVLTNDAGERLALRLGSDEKSWFFRVLSWQMSAGPVAETQRQAR